MKNKNQKPAGFSLIELLFAMTFLTVIVFGVIRLQTSQLTIGNTQENQLKAHYYASEGLAITEAIGYADLGGCGDPVTCYLSRTGVTYSLSGTEPEELEDGLFTREIEKTEVLTDGYLVTAIIRWTDSSGDHQAEAKQVIYQGT